jgi:hypothetical protein
MSTGRTFCRVSLLQGARAHAVERQLLRWRTPPSQCCTTAERGVVKNLLFGSCGAKPYTKTGTATDKQVAAKNIGRSVNQRS